MSKNELQALVDNGYSQRQIANKKKCSQATVKYWLKKYNIRTNFNRFNKKEKLFKCADCGECDPNKFLILRKKGKECIHHSLCKRCHNKRCIERQRKYKKLAVEYKGGKCCRCGYSKCAGSLHFHHPDPSVKEKNWRNVRNMSFSKIKMLIDKCELLCANCHGEEHWFK